MRINAFMLQSIVLVEILIFFKNYDGNHPITQASSSISKPLFMPK